MVESGPFIEYCCELYIHHDLVNSVVAAVMVFAALQISPERCEDFASGGVRISV